MELAPHVRKEIGLLVKGFASRAVPALVSAQVDVVVRYPPAHEFLYARNVVGIRRADEPVVRDLPQVREAPEVGGVPVHERLRRDTRGFRGFEILRAVLVSSG